MESLAAPWRHVATSARKDEQHRRPPTGKGSGLNPGTTRFTQPQAPFDLSKEKAGGRSGNNGSDPPGAVFMPQNGDRCYALWHPEEAAGVWVGRWGGIVAQYPGASGMRQDSVDAAVSWLVAHNHHTFSQRPVRRG